MGRNKARRFVTPRNLFTQLQPPDDLPNGFVFRQLNYVDETILPRGSMKIQVSEEQRDFLSPTSLL